MRDVLPGDGARPDPAATLHRGAGHGGRFQSLGPWRATFEGHGVSFPGIRSLRHPRPVTDTPLFHTGAGPHHPAFPHRSGGPITPLSHTGAGPHHPAFPHTSGGPSLIDNSRLPDYG